MNPGEGPLLRQEVITLDEGDVTITFPTDLSSASLMTSRTIWTSSLRRCSGARGERS
jgi:hypothetical protein